MLHIALWGSLGWLLYAHAAATQEMPYLTITAARESYLAQSVFAQFVYAQKLTFDRPARITKLIVPMNLPDNPLPLKIRLMQEGKPIYSWIFPLEEEKGGVVEAHLPFAAPTLLEGSVELIFDGSSIDHDHKEQAPGLFIEPKNEGYRGGNYRIADNQKQGDIALEFTETKTNYELFLERLEKNILGTISFLCITIAGMILLGLFPFMTVQMLPRKKG